MRETHAIAAVLWRGLFAFKRMDVSVGKTEKKKISNICLFLNCLYRERIFVYNAIKTVKEGLRRNKRLLLVDMQSFYASVEKVDFPQYKNQPLVVSGIQSVEVELF